jgi:hypothetical protein
MYHHTGQPLPWKHWLKWLAVVDVERQLILAQSARQAPWNDCANLPTLVAEAHQHTPVGCVLADAEFDSERNHTFCREQLEADSIIPAKRQEDLEDSRSAGANESGFPPRKVCPPIPDRNRLLNRQTKTLLPRSRKNCVHASPLGTPPRTYL